MAQGAEADVSGGRISGKLEIPIEHDVDGDRFVDDAALVGPAIAGESSTSLLEPAAFKTTSLVEWAVGRVEGRR